MARKKTKTSPNAGSTSTKQLNGVRRNGVLYLDRGVGTGCFANVNPSSSSMFEENTGSSHILPKTNKK